MLATSLIKAVRHVFNHSNSLVIPSPKVQVDPRSIGRLEVGTETVIDKSKSVKTVLMQLFEESGNTNVEGIDTINACYGGTNALFNALNWVESSAWDGRDAVVIAADIAIYPAGPARATGGAGAIAMLIGPNAPIVAEPIRGSYMTHEYDFYKADLSSEYPLLDGQRSVRCYTTAVDHCYQDYTAREKALGCETAVDVNAAAQKSPSDRLDSAHAGQGTPLDRFDYMCFHSPTWKLVAKSYGRLLSKDYRTDPEAARFQVLPPELGATSCEASLDSEAIEKTFSELTAISFKSRVKPSLEAATMCGNLYYASLYGALVSLISNVDSADLLNKRIGCFSYGSGLASSMFSFKIRECVSDIRQALDLHKRLAKRIVVSPEQIVAICELRERAYLRRDYEPKGTVEAMAPGTYYLTKIDEKFRRTYRIKT